MHLEVSECALNLVQKYIFFYLDLYGINQLKLLNSKGLEVNIIFVKFTTQAVQKLEYIAFFPSCFSFPINNYGERGY
jgi:hypothetical protein